MARKQGFNRSTAKAAHRDNNKTKQTRSLKNKLRDVQRLLKKSDLPATVRVVQERMLDVLQDTIKEKAKEGKEKSIMKRSKKVKFFEKRKLFRKYKTCLKELKECNEDEARNALQKELQDIKLKWNYVIHFPEDTKYISLFPLTSYTNVEVRQKQEQILQVISEKVASGELDDASKTIGKMSSGSKEGKAGKLKLTKPENGQAVGKKERKEESEDESPPKLNFDDDFFIDSSPNTGPSTSEEESKQKKKKAANKRKRSQFKFEKK